MLCRLAGTLSSAAGRADLLRPFAMNPGCDVLEIERKFDIVAPIGVLE
jgi:hypothetical protein